MNYSKIPVHTWYLAMPFMSFSKKTTPEAELQRQLDHPKYDAVWGLMYKTRKALKTVMSSTN